MTKFLRILMGFILPFLLINLACSGVTNLTPTPPESGYRYDDLPSPTKQSSAISAYTAIASWNKTDLSYYFVNGTDQLAGDTEQDVIAQAFGLWAAETPLTFTETNSRSEADIIIGWASGDHGDGDSFDGPGDVLAHASYPNPYDDRPVFLHFDDDERWVNNASRNVDLLTVAAHEIGHTLGLDHSDDFDSLMYPSYSGPHRFLAADDIAGIQSLYGLASNPQPAPNVPADDAPPPSADEDSDQDGIADQDEVLITGTDPKNEDSDNDGLGDGVEVENRMNPLDPDMDKDGVNDGQEVANGTDPLFPEQPDVSSELEEEVSDFLTEAIELQIEAYQRGDASIASSILAGDVLDNLAADINALNQQGLVAVSEIDYYESYINDIRVVSDTMVEVDTCEVWATNTYDQSSGDLVQTDGPTLLPQTITVENLNSGWFITQVNFLDAPAFCTN